MRKDLSITPIKQLKTSGVSRFGEGVSGGMDDSCSGLSLDTMQSTHWSKRQCS